MEMQFKIYMKFIDSQKQNKSDIQKANKGA